MMQKRVIVICGQVCSGKTTFAQTLVNHRHVDVGDIVRAIAKTNDRQHIADLDQEIIKELEKELAKGDKIVITGIRQKSIFYSIAMQTLGTEQLDVIWLEVPEEQLKRRWINRDDVKDRKISFEEAIERDNKLGLEDLKKYLWSTYLWTRVIKNYDTHTL